MVFSLWFWSACSLFILSDTRKNSKKGLFLWHGKTLLAFQREGLRRRSRTALRTSTLSTSAHRVWEGEREFWQELWGDPCWPPTGGGELAESWVCVCRDSVSDPLPQVSGESLGVLSTPGSRQNFSMVSLGCLAAFISIYICTKGYSYPLGRQTELHKVQTSPLIKVTVKQSNLVWFFFSSPRMMGFILKQLGNFPFPQSSKET